MSILTLQVNESKMAYALICKCLDLHQEAWALKIYGLKQFFPNIETQCPQVFAALRFAVSSSITWTGQSMTKADTVPDDTRVPPNVEVNEALVRTMHVTALSLGVNMSDEYIFTDVAGDFMEALGTWAAAAKIYLDIIGIAEEFTMYKPILADMYLQDVGNIERSPGQLVPFMGCGVPIANNGLLVEKLNWDGIVAACGTYCMDIMVFPALDIFNAAPGTRTTQTIEVVVEAEADPDFLTTKTVYSYTTTAPVIGVISAVGSNGVFYPVVNMTGATSFSLCVALPIAEAPATMTIKIHTMEAL